MTEPYLPTIRTQADLETMWRHLMGPLGFGYRRVYVVFVAPDGQVVPRITEIAELPDLPDVESCANLIDLCAHIIDAQLPMGTSVAFLYARPGGPDFTTADRRWGAVLLQSAEQGFVPTWPVHLANDHQLRVLAPDDLAHPA